MFTKVDESVRDYAMKIKDDPELYAAYVPQIMETLEELTLKKNILVL